MFEKKIKILYVRTYNFINDKTGESVTGAKCSYHFLEPIDDKEEKGYRVELANLSLETGRDIISKLPYECIGKFDITKDNKLKLVAISK